MYKVIENIDFLRPYHQLVCDILKALRRSSRQNVTYTKLTLKNNLISINPLFSSIVNRGAFLDNIHKLKDSQVDIYKEYGSSVRRYKSILNRKWNGRSKLNHTSSKEIKNVFIFFYENLVEYKTLNEAFFQNVNSLSNFRAIMSLNKVCPYCDINKINKDSVSVDHYLPKSTFPILSIYPDNLIVSCKACNESIKGENYLLPIIHPYYEDVSSYFTFVINDSNEEKFEIEIKMNKDNSKLLSEKVQNFLSLFKIKERYEIDMIGDLKDFRQDIRKRAYAELRGIARNRNITDVDIRECTENSYKEAIIQNELLHRAVDGTKIKNDYINQILQRGDFQSDIDYLESQFGGIGNLFN